MRDALSQLTSQLITLLSLSSPTANALVVGGNGAFFFFRLMVLPSVDDANDDVDPLKLWPGELVRFVRNDGSGVIDALQYLCLSMFSRL
jgi:hypothetical protein